MIKGLELFEQARARIQDYVVKTPLRRWEHLRRLTKAEAPIFLKLETFQNTGSFKVRGAANRILEIIESDPHKDHHFIAASAGNHAQAVAYVAGRLKMKSTIVMPEGTPLVKSAATEDYGAQVVLHGALYDEAFARAQELLSESPNASYIHAYADHGIIAGQGTAGLEIHEQLLEQGIEAQQPLQLVVPIGGGGLISGVASVLKILRPNVKVYGVVSEVADAMARSLETGSIQKARNAGTRTLAEGLAVKTVSPLTFEYIEKLCERIAVVSDSEVANAIFTMMERGKIVAEGAGAAGVAALLGKKLELDPKVPTVVLVCGGNIDMNMVSTILEKALVGDERWLSFGVVVEDKPGQLAKLTQIIGKCRANVLDLSHDRLSSSCPVGYTIINFRLETRGHQHAKEIMTTLQEEGFSLRQQS